MSEWHARAFTQDRTDYSLLSVRSKGVSARSWPAQAMRDFVIRATAVQSHLRWYRLRRSPRRQTSTDSSRSRQCFSFATISEMRSLLRIANFWKTYARAVHPPELP